MPRRDFLELMEPGALEADPVLAASGLIFAALQAVEQPCRSTAAAPSDGSDGPRKPRRRRGGRTKPSRGAAVADPAIAEAVERQTAAMRELSRRAFPEPDAVADDAPAPIEQARAQRRRQTAATEAAALRRTRAEKAGTLPPPPRTRLSRW